MSEKEMNSYRFTSGEEPSDEMLRQLMQEVAHEAKQRNHEATDAYFKEMRLEASRKRQKWSDRINNAING